MSLNVDSRKLKLIEKIAALSSPKDIEAAENYFNSLEKINQNSDLFKPMREDITLADLKKEQHFNGINRKKIDQLAQKLDITESFDDLVAMLD